MRLLPFLFVLVFAQLAQAAAAETAFSGTATKGQPYTHALADGLVLQLAPSDYGWQIEVHPADDTTIDLADINLPLHGINATQLEGWHFLVEGQEAAAPGAERRITYALTAAQRDQVMAYYECVMAKPDCPAPPAGLEVGTLLLTVTDYDIPPVPPEKTGAFGQLGAFSRVAFNVTYARKPFESVTP